MTARREDPQTAIMGRPAAARGTARGAILALAGALAALAPVGPAAAWDANAPVTREYPELHSAYYDISVCEYCGLVTSEVADGFRREVADLIARDRMSQDQNREVRIHAWTAADLEYGNRGLGGFRNWCKTEGLAAVQRFTGYGAAARPDAPAPE